MDDYICRSKLSHAVNDRLSTYHILREELMRTEDETKGRELNLAWQRISRVRLRHLVLYLVDYEELLAKDKHHC